MTPIEAAYESCKDRTHLSFEDFKEAVSGWDVLPVLVNGETAGAIMLNGPEIHACILPAFFCKWLRPGLFKKLMIERKSKFGFLRTSVARGNETGRNFVERLGFKHIKTVRDIEIYEVT